jgi:hypothetical protein
MGIFYQQDQLHGNNVVGQFARLLTFAVFNRRWPAFFTEKRLLTPLSVDLFACITQWHRLQRMKYSIRKVFFTLLFGMSSLQLSTNSKCRKIRCIVLRAYDYRMSVRPQD